MYLHSAVFKVVRLPTPLPSTKSILFAYPYRARPIWGFNYNTKMHQPFQLIAKSFVIFLSSECHSNVIFNQL